MEPTLSTPRLKLTLIKEAKRGSQELEWMHELRSDEKTTWWSIHGQSKSLEDTENFLKHCLPSPEYPQAIRIAYAVCERVTEVDMRFIGLITLKSSTEISLPEANHLMPPSALDLSSVLNLELGYQFLPISWGHGFATEALVGVFTACHKSASIWESYKRVFVRAIVDAENPGSLGVMKKSDMSELGVHVWMGEKAWMAGDWRNRMTLHIWGMWLVE